jgi:multisubunit Na+/H+ antiporter MnhB subunit
MLDHRRRPRRCAFNRRERYRRRPADPTVVAMRFDRRPVAISTAGAAAVVAYGWWFTDRTPFTGGALVGLLVATVLLIGFAHAHRRRRSAPRDRVARGGAVAWSVLVVAIVVWELLALHGAPRAEHPTISSFATRIERHHLVRVALFAAWIAFGWVIAA